jgi:ornithine cyclodeaminase/alanine dehydrogenase-like protein (mu-crystallin family)
MSVLFLSEGDVREVLTMEMALEAVEDVLRQHALEEAHNVPRARCQTGGAMLHVMSAAVNRPGVLGYKAYCTTRQGAHFHVGLYDAATGTLLALMQADWLGQMRTGAASGVATRHMARADAAQVGLFGAGKQAATQLLAVCQVLRVQRVVVYSRDEGRRRRFCETMARQCACEVEPAARPDLAARDKDVVITATTSKEPVLSGDWLADGTHLNVVGSNFLGKAEIDAATVRRAKVIVVDSKEQAKLEAGDFALALEEGALHWADVHELGQVIAGRYPGRKRPDDVTLFKSVGVALEDVAVAARVYDAAKTRGIGRSVDFAT